MSVKSKKWYENQIKALENAAKNTGRFMIQLKCYEPGTKAYERDLLECQNITHLYRKTVKKFTNN